MGVAARGNINKDSKDRGEMAHPRTGGRSQKADSKGRVVLKETGKVVRRQLVRIVHVSGMGGCWGGMLGFLSQKLIFPCEEEVDLREARC